MNKAFVREPDSTAVHCPRCGSLGTSVGESTLQAHVPETLAREISKQAYFCPFATCEVAYFDTFERVVPAESLNRPVYPKDPAAPICACFGLTTEDIESDLAENDVQRVRALLEKARSPEAQCERLAADGRCCAAEVQRYYMRRRQEND